MSHAHFGSRSARKVAEITDNLSCLDRGGFWADTDLTGRRWLRFAASGAITWGSDPAREWAETELKAARLVGLASGRVGPSDL